MHEFVSREIKTPYPGVVTVLLIMSWGNNDLINDTLWRGGGMIAIKLCPGIKFPLLLIHRGCMAIRNSPMTIGMVDWC